MTDTNNIEPKPCPFCGKTNAKRHCDHANGWIGCECGASGPRINLDVDRYPGDSFRPNEEQKVISAWNRRTLSARASAGEGGWVYGVSSPATGCKPYIAPADSTIRFYIEDQFGDAVARHEYLKALVAELNTATPASHATGHDNS